jgi:hypothetical protein
MRLSLRRYYLIYAVTNQRTDKVTVPAVVAARTTGNAL